MEWPRQRGRCETRLNALAAPYEARAGIAWLRKSGDQIVTVDLDRGVTRIATAEELANGAYFKDFAEYQAANGLTAEPPGA